jgi:hypothetical protein
MAKVALWVICRRCETAFDSGLRMDERAFTRGTLAANYHACPHCTAREVYRKVDYELRDAPVGRTGPA